jgi:ribosome-binding protein aMBF1 (putative translation factor)
MDKQKKRKLEKEGFRVGTAADFLELSPQEEAYIEIRLEMGKLIRHQRKKHGWTQAGLAQALGSSQSRVAKMETGEPGTSLDLMIKNLLQLGLSRHELGDVLAGKRNLRFESA